jgi:hypothetical protein
MVHSASDAPKQPRSFVYSQYHTPPLHSILCIKCTAVTPTTCGTIRHLCMVTLHQMLRSNRNHLCMVSTMPTSAWYTLHQMYRSYPDHLCIVSTMRHLCVVHSASDAPLQPRPRVCTSQYHAPHLHGTLCISCTVATATTCVKSVPCATSAWYTLHQMHSNPDHLCIVSTMRHLCIVHSSSNAP